MRLEKGMLGGAFFVAAVVCGAVLGNRLISVLLIAVATALIRSSQTA